jgi:hypothetical protein
MVHEESIQPTHSIDPNYDASNHLDLARVDFNIPPRSGGGTKTRQAAFFASFAAAATS